MGDPRTRSDDTTPAPRATLAAVAALAGDLMLGVGHAAAQQAMVVVSHDDPDGIVLPGQTVQITTTVSWTGPSVYGLGEIKGGVLASPDAGQSGNPRFPYSQFGTNSSQTIDPGRTLSGSVVGIHVHPFIGAWVIWGIPVQWPWSMSAGIDVHRFDWTAPMEAGAVAFGFSGDPTLPGPTFMLTSTVPQLVSLPTTYVSTSLTVIPAPASAAVLGLAGAALGRRRRGWQGGDGR